jgi:sn-1 stearoyl-lipid 9-desaturase
MLRFLSTFALSYLWHGLGVTVGYHRLLSHRSFKCAKAVEYLFVLGGYLAFEGSPLWWAAIHRAHHKYADTPLDPHSPRYGVKNAHYGWMTKKTYPAHITPKLQCPDLTSDPVYSFLDQGGEWHRAHALAALSGFLFRAALWNWFGWRVALASALAGGAVLQIPLLLNVICHTPRLGYKNYARDDDSVNVWWVALLANGEGWHNNHHAFPGSARSGFKPHEFDLSWQTLRLLRSVGLVTWMNEPKPDQLKLAVSKQAPETAGEPAPITFRKHAPKADRELKSITARKQASKIAKKPAPNTARKQASKSVRELAPYVAP